MPDNDRLKVILHDAKLICRHKFNRVQDEFGEDNEEVKEIGQEIKSVFSRLNHPLVWTEPIPFDEDHIVLQILAIDSTAPTELDKYLEATHTFLQFIEEDLCKEPFGRIIEVEISDWNLKTMNALRIALQQVDGRIIFFKDQGIDLNEDPDFQERHEHQAEVAETYRLLLQTNGIDAGETDVLVIKRLGEAIDVQEELEKFFRLHNRLTTFIEDKIKPFV